MKTVVVIPARYGSTRFLGKPLFLIKDKPLIWYVCQKAKQCKNVDLIAVATDDKRIYDAVKSFGCSAFMTPETCKNGTERLAFTAQKELKDYDIFINIQGDEPLIDPNLISRLASGLQEDKNLEFITAAYPLKDETDIKNPNIVKVVFDKNGYALYFSRHSIPYNRDNTPAAYYKHIGVYGYTRDFLINFSKMPASPLEKAESLEQLRALESGCKIKVIIAAKDTIGVDAPQDIEKVAKYL
ncbi:MAG: 3-deoxy-manno-octulosonate cytidylyltransferase [Elusimicrobiota bacterium]|jgi:3-deoxy-manno-octulosonate cytidylyltransferase (CMP-KDO synthetase)|nr:3-deoxy-manno-octulosonate cytidylyltransferase [Elusimicrobiota bacterium]